MIRLQRTRTPEAIPAEYCAPKRLIREQELIEMAQRYHRKELKTYEFKDSYWKQAKKQLKAETHGKCAYCEAPTDAVAHGDVEHFRPKSVYWWLAYCYDNYLFACQVCNQKHKGDMFPTDGPRWEGPSLSTIAAGSLGVDPLADEAIFEQFQQAFAGEQASLPNPYYLDPEPYFVWKADDVLKEVLVLPNPTHPDSQRVHQAVDEYYGLNRKELRGLRYQIYKFFEVAKLATRHPHLPPDLVARFAAQVQQAQEPAASFAGMVRYFDSVL